MAYDGGFDHEKLDVYRLSIEFQRWVGPLIEGGLGTGARLSAAKHLDDASTSISNNIAEETGRDRSSIGAASWISRAAQHWSVRHVSMCSLPAIASTQGLLKRAKPC